MNNRRELLLLAAFLGALLIAVGAFGWKRYSAALAAQREEMRQKQLLLSEAANWVQEQDIWKKKGDWLAANPLPAYAGQPSEAAFVQEIQASLNTAGIEIRNQTPKEAEHKGRLVEVGVDLSLTAPLEKLVRWLFEVQKPGSYRVFNRIDLKSDADQTKIQADISLIQLYNQPGT